MPTAGAKEENVQQRKLSGKRTGEVLVEMGILTPAQVDLAIEEQRSTRQRIGDIALAKGWCTKAKLMEALAMRLGVKYLDLGNTRVDPVTADLVSEKDARRYSAIPISFVDDHTLLVAMADPSNIVAIDDLRILTGFDIEPAIATQDDIGDAALQHEAQGRRDRRGHGRQRAKAMTTSARANCATSASRSTPRRWSSSSTACLPVRPTKGRRTSTSSPRRKTC